MRVKIVTGKEFGGSSTLNWGVVEREDEAPNEPPEPAWRWPVAMARPEARPPLVVANPSMKVDKALDVQPVWRWEGVTTDSVGVTPRKVNDRFNQKES